MELGIQFRFVYHFNLAYFRVHVTTCSSFVFLLNGVEHRLDHMDCLLFDTVYNCNHIINNSDTLHDGHIDSLTMLLCDICCIVYTWRQMMYRMTFWWPTNMT